MTREAVVVDFPLRGEGWVAVNSPADRIPSHGTDMLGQRFAYDFIKTDERSGRHYHRAGWLRTLVLGVPTRECYAWGAPVHAPFDGVVVRAVDGRPERARVHPVREAFLALRNALTFRPERLPQILGNHVILQRGEVVRGVRPPGAGLGRGARGRVRRGRRRDRSRRAHGQLDDAASPHAADGWAGSARGERHPVRVPGV